MKTGLAFPAVVVLLLTCVVAACSDDETTGPAPPSGGDPPVIVSVSWQHDPGCTPGTTSGVFFIVNAVDPDTDPNDLIYTGSATNCSGSIDASTATIACPQLGQYAGFVTVTDPEGNSHTVNFLFGPCQNGTAP